MKKPKLIALAGHVLGMNIAAIERAMMNKDEDEVIVIVNDEPIERNPLITRQSGPSYLQLNPLPELPKWPGEKIFKCTGKHNYTNETGIWKCQCGREL